MFVSRACQLRLLEESDADELYALIDTNRAYLSRWMPWAGGQDLEDTLRFIRRAHQQLLDNDGLQAALLCEDAVIGVVGYHSVNWAHRSTSIGYWLAEQHQGHGTMTSTVRALVSHALRTWKLNRVEIRVAPQNTRSRAIPERLGFREEGTLHQAERIEDRFLDSVIYGMLASAWEAQPVSVCPFG